MARKHTPWYDERFRQYGYNKARLERDARRATAFSACSFVAAPAVCLQAAHLQLSHGPNMCMAIRCLQAGHVKTFVAWGGRLVVHPRAFTIHVPHERSQSYRSAFRPQSSHDVQRRAQARGASGAVACGAAGRAPRLRLDWQHACGPRFARRAVSSCSPALPGGSAVDAMHMPHLC